MAKDRAALTRQIREANDIVAVVGGYLQLTSTGNPDVYKGLCPFHNDHRPSMQVSLRYQNFRCWSCGKTGDVFTFVQEYEKVSFLEARAILARRANIALDEDDGESMARMRQLEAVRWAAEQYQVCLLDSPLGEVARKYLGERKLTGETVRRFGLGYAPGGGEWLVNRLHESSVPQEVFEEVGLIAKRDSGGWYDRFRDRLMFPVRNTQGQVVGFGGRVLPGTPAAEKGPKYYNSAESPVFNKSELMYGLDLARQAAASAGYLAVVEGYTDVMMAHQCGVPQVVATMGTALTPRHVQQLLRYVPRQQPRIVLVYDADEGGSTGVDRALAIFASQNVELAIATLPDGMDPCDLLVQRGPEPFREALANAIDALEFKLDQLLEREAGNGIEGQRRVIDGVLSVIAAMDENADTPVQLKRDLMLTRIAQRLSVNLDTVRTRLGELRRTRRVTEERAAELTQGEGESIRRSAPAPAHERELLELLLAHPDLVPPAMERVALDDVIHPGLHKLLGGLYDLQKAGQTPDFDALRPRIDNPRLADYAVKMRDVGRESTADADLWLKQVLAVFEAKKAAELKERLKSQLTAATDPAAQMELLRKLQSEKVGAER